MKPLILWGGTDINPSIYKKSPLKYTQSPDNFRDSAELKMIENAIKSNTPVVGVCRGAQLLCAYNGGTLFQHSIPTKQCHSLSTLDGSIFKEVTAGHHQIMVPRGNHIVYAWNPNYVEVFIEDEISYKEAGTAEVVWWPETKCLAIQPHPECAPKYEPFVHWINELMKTLNISYSF